MARPGPFRPQRRPWVHAALRAASPGRVRTGYRGTGGLPAMGKPDAGASRVRAHAWSRDHHRASGRGCLERGGHGHSRSLPGGDVQSAWLHPGGSPHVRGAGRRRPDGRGVGRGRFAGGPLGAGQVDLSVRRQSHLHRRLHRSGLHRGRGPRGSRPMDGRC